MARKSFSAIHGVVRQVTQPFGLAAVFILAACGGGATAPGGGNGGGGGVVAVSSVAVSAPSTALLVGVSDSVGLGTTTVTATAKDASGNILSGRTITWSSSAAAVATVSAAGVITAVSPGTANISATSEGQIGSVAVTVTRPAVASLVIAPAAPALLVGVADSANLSVATFSATPKDAAGHQLTGRTIAWTSTVPTVATVNGNGTVTALSVGTTSINASSEGQTGSVSVTVARPAVATVTMSAAPPTLLTGVADSTNLGTATVTATPKDASGHILTGRPLTWSSSATSVASVSSAGLVKAVGAGNTTITATIEGQSGTVGVTVVKPAVAQVVVSPLTSSLKVGASENLTITLLDSQSHVLTGRFFGVGNNTPSIIDANGPQITAKAAGTGSVTYTSIPENVSTTATITVTP